MTVVTLIFLDGSTRTVTAETAVQICTDPAQAWKVLDALTADAELQSRLRQYMDEY